jgi:hypothetical protein
MRISRAGKPTWWKLSRSARSAGEVTPTVHLIIASARNAGIPSSAPLEMSETIEVRVRSADGKTDETDDDHFDSGAAP